MTYLLDTNACIVCMNVRAPRMRERLAALKPADVAVCSVVKAELFYGAAKSRDTVATLEAQQRFLEPFVSLPFDDAAALRYGELRGYLEPRGELIGGNDLLIAAIALANDLTLVTHNTPEFSRAPGLRVEDWEAQL